MSNLFHPELFRGRSYLVTGGSRGIGDATVRLLLQHGASVAVVARDPDVLDAMEAELASDHDLMVASADVSDADAVAKVLGKCRQRWGRLHGVVNNAMANPVGTVAALDEAAFHQAWNVNAMAAWRIVKLALPLLKTAGGGAVVNVSSVMAHQTSPGNHAYASSKGALEALSRNLAVELAPLRVRVNSVIPGYIRTYQGLEGRDLPRESWPESTRLRAQYIDVMTEKGQPWPSHGRPEDCAAAIAFLLSDGAAFITGTSLVVDGGLLVDFKGLHDPHRLAAANELAQLERDAAKAEAREAYAVDELTHDSVESQAGVS